MFRGDYYLFSTNQAGYWWSSDMSRWNFVPRKFLTPENQVLADGRIIYDSATGRIWYDADGSGSAAQKILFATVDPGTALTAADFFVYG